MAATSLRLVRLLLLTAVGALSLTGPASAHAAYEDSTPRDGETVSSPPDRVIVDFTERIIPESTLSVSDPCGAEVDNNDSVVVNDRITISMSADKQGTYTVRFAVQSAVDGHNTQGQFTFTSSSGSACDSGRQEAEPDDEATRERTTQQRTRDQDRVGTDRDAREDRQGSRSIASGRDRDGQRKRAQTRRDKGDRARTDTSRDIAAGEEDLEANEVASIWDGIPLRDFAVALGIAALIGAAGGRIYAGIVGPVDKPAGRTTED